MTQHEVVCAVDVGSSAVKAAVYTGVGEMSAHAVTYLSLQRTDIVAEIDADALWRTVAQAVRVAVVRSGRMPSTLIITAQMAGQCLLDVHDRPIGPVVMGIDRRHDPDAGAVRDSRQISRLGWWAIHRPGELAAADRLGGVKEYLLWRATGEWDTDPSSASVSGFFNLAQQIWTPPAFLDHVRMPGVRPSEQVVGRLRPDAAADLGLTADTEVLCGIGDGPAASLATGAIGPGRLCLTLGTTSVARLILDAELPTAIPAPAPTIFVQQLCDGWYCTGTRAEGDVDLTELVNRWEVDEIRVIGGHHDPATSVRLANATGRRVCTTGVSDGTAGAALIAFHPGSWLHEAAALPVVTVVNPEMESPCQS